MTRKDFERIAAVLRYCAEHCDSGAELDLVLWVAEKFADDLASTNARFDRERFIDAASLIREAPMSLLNANHRDTANEARCAVENRACVVRRLREAPHTQAAAVQAELDLYRDVLEHIASTHPLAALALRARPTERPS